MVDELMIEILARRNDILSSSLHKYRRKKFACHSKEVQRVLGQLNKEEVFHILLHSHYDPAWFARRSITRKMLGSFYKKVVKLLDGNDEYRFTADSQTQVIEDILSNFKGRKRKKFAGKLSQYISSGRLVAGPYYAGIDLNLSSSAVLRRNILYGLKDAGKLGWKGSHVGWMIDQFGFPSQMWQLHKKFGIDSIILWRGLGLKPDEAKAEIFLESPDGSRILGKWLFVQGYRFGLYVGKYSDIGVPRLVQESGKIKKYTASSQMLIMDGYEGEDSPDDPALVVDMMRSLGGQVKISTPGIFMSDMAADIAGGELPVVRGYQNYGYYSPVLKGVVSARQYIKQAHQLCDNTLAKLVDPAAVFAVNFGVEQDELKAEKMWRDLIRMASHDELGGCGIDDVHRDSFDVYRGIYSDAVSYSHGIFENIAAQVDTYDEDESLPAVLFNTLPFDRWGNVRMRIALPDDWGAFYVKDGAGKSFETQVLKSEGNLKDITVRFTEDDPIPSFGYRTVFVVRGTMQNKQDPSGLVSGDDWMENEYLRIEINDNGTFDLTFKDTGKVWKGLGYIRVEPDGGDTYDFSHIENHSVITSLDEKASVNFEYTGSLDIRCRISLSMMVPASITEDRKSWSSEKKELKVVLFLVLKRSSSRLDMDVQLDSELKDSRIRICFPVETESSDMFVNRQFEVYKMPFSGSGLSAEEKEDIFKHMNGMISSGMDVIDVKTGINFKWVDIPVPGAGSESEEGLGIINRDNFEFEIRNEAARDKVVEFTLIRSVGWNARSDLLTRNINAGWEIYTPDAFCYGRYRFSFSLLPHGGDWKNGNLLRESDLKDTSVVSVAPGKHKGNLPSDYSMFNVRTGTIVVSEVSYIADNGSKNGRIVFILYNPGEETDSIIFSFRLKVVSANISDLDGKSSVNVVSGGRDEFSLSLRKKEIVELSVEFEPVSAGYNGKNIAGKGDGSVLDEGERSLDNALGLEMRPSVCIDEVYAEKRRWKECLRRYRDELSSYSLSVPLKTLEDFIKKYTDEEALINLENTVKEARYSYLLTLKRYYETSGKQRAADRVEKSVARMGRQLIDLRVKKREAEIYRIFFENLSNTT